MVISMIRNRSRRALRFAVASLVWASAVAVGLWCAAAPSTGKAVSAPPAAQPSLWVAPSQPDIARYRDWIATLASEKMEGRGPGTKGIQRARDYIAQQFDKAGLKPLCRPAAKQSDSSTQLSYLQPFETRVGTKVKEAKLTSAAGGKTCEFQLDKDYTVMGFSAPAVVQGQATFVGYSVKNDKQKYDSYATDGKPAAKGSLKGKIAICWRYEPMTAAGQSAWGDKGTWKAAQLGAKAALAASHGAAAMLFINPPAHEKDGLRSTAASIGPAAPIPVLQITPTVLKAILAQAGRPADDNRLRQMQKDADNGRTGPQTLEGATISLTVKLEAQNVAIHNVAAVLPGAGALADECIVIGAHYDHLGYTGGDGDGERQIYFGADDNASGTSAVLLLAQRFGQLLQANPGLPANRRCLVFVAFTGEERGLLGSKYMVDHLDQMGLKPERITAMINLDVVGRMQNDRAMVGGVGSGDRWDSLLDAALRGSGLSVRRSPSGYGPSDHSSFYQAKIPVLFFAGSFHSDIHSTRDTADKINCEGAVKIANLVDAIVRQLWTDPVRMAYVAPKPGQEQLGGVRRTGPYLGILPGPVADDAKGVCVAGLLSDGPAVKANLKTGDVIVKWGPATIASPSDLFGALSKQKPGDKVKLTIQRGQQTLELDVTLGKW